MKAMQCLLLLAMNFLFINANSQEKQLTKLADVTKVLTEFANLKESIPEQLLNVSEGIIVIPKMINVGLGIAGKRGKGIAVVKDASGKWSSPVFVTLTGGSVGLQAGVQSVDLILVFKSSETLQNIGNGSFTLGGDVSVTAGPFGRNSTASTDYKFEAEVYSYSKSKGLFAGISISGSAIDVDEKAINNFYGEDIDAKTLFETSEKNTSSETQALVQALDALYKPKSGN